MQVAERISRAVPASAGCASARYPGLRPDHLGRRSKPARHLRNRGTGGSAGSHRRSSRNRAFQLFGKIGLGGRARARHPAERPRGVLDRHDKPIFRLNIECFLHLARRGRQFETFKPGECDCRAIAGRRPLPGRPEVLSASSSTRSIRTTCRSSSGVSKTPSTNPQCRSTRSSSPGNRSCRWQSTGTGRCPQDAEPDRSANVDRTRWSKLIPWGRRGRKRPPSPGS